MYSSLSVIPLCNIGCLKYAKSGEKPKLWFGKLTLLRQQHDPELPKSKRFSLIEYILFFTAIYSCSRFKEEEFEGFENDCFLINVDYRGHLLSLLGDIYCLAVKGLCLC